MKKHVAFAVGALGVVYGSLLFGEDDIGLSQERTNSQGIQRFSYEQKPSTPIAYLGPESNDPIVNAHFNQGTEYYSEIWRLNLDPTSISFIKDGSVFSIPNPGGYGMNSFINVYVSDYERIEIQVDSSAKSFSGRSFSGSLIIGKEPYDLNLAIVESDEGLSISGLFSTPDGSYQISNLNKDPEQTYVMRYSKQS